MKILEDNQAAIAMARNPVHHGRQKHIEVQFHFVRDEIERGNLIIDYCQTEEMAADLLTKPLPRPAFRANLRLLGLTSRLDWAGD